jgi:NADH dehydrogenase FAD-containing subunit
MTRIVAVVGGGYGGITVAKALDEFADVVLVEPKDTFVHNVAGLRGLVDPAWAEQIFLPYEKLLRRGTVLRDRATRVDSTTINLAAGGSITAEYVVLATGSAYPFPAKVDVTERVAAIAKLRAVYEALAAAEDVLLLGAGPVGLELAGEIRGAWPEKSVTIVDPASGVVTGHGLPEEFHRQLREQLDELGVRLLLGTELDELPPVEPGVAKTFTARTRRGELVQADVWFRCHGVTPTTDYLAGDLAEARLSNGSLAVTPELRLAGHDSIFAIGDVTAVAEPKMAKAAEKQAEVVAANIRALIEGTGQLLSYEPGPPGIALPLGPTGGVSYAESAGVLGAAMTARIKGTSLRVEVYRDLLNLGS